MREIKFIHVSVGETSVVIDGQRVQLRESFVCATRDTSDEAIVAAWADLESAMEQSQANAVTFRGDNEIVPCESIEVRQVDGGRFFASGVFGLLRCADGVWKSMANVGRLRPRVSQTDISQGS